MRSPRIFSTNWRPTETLFKSLSFYVRGESGALAPDSPLWNLPLSGRSPEFASSFSNSETASSWTIGLFFEAAGRFIRRKEVLADLTRALGADAPPSSDWHLSLILEKHGAYYHPIKLVVEFQGGQRHLFVLNGTVSSRGMALMEKEIPLLSVLADRFNCPMVPGVYGRGHVVTSRGEAGFFLGQWFERFHEFHITGDGRELVVWRPGKTDLYLTLDRGGPIYEQIARVLTLAYDMETGKQIFPWHHAAGDFIVDPGKSEMPVRLVTVRGYDALVDIGGTFAGLLFFLANLSLHMRLDRIDGVGRPVFLDASVLRATLKGFIKGMGQAPHGFSPSKIRGFMDFAARFDPDQWLNILIQLMDVWPPGRLEGEAIIANLAPHCCHLSALFKSHEFQDFY